MKTSISHSIEATEKMAADWLDSVSGTYSNDAVDANAGGQALVVGLSGHLGAGKTAFVKAVAKALGVDESVTSPTFVLMKIYEIEKLKVKGQKSKLASPWKRLIHIDAYRLEQAEELQALNWEGLVADSNNLIMVKRPENVGLEEFAPEDSTHTISI